MEGRSEMRVRRAPRRARDQVYLTVVHAGRDLERFGDELRRKLARALRRLAPAVVHVGAQLAHELRELSRRIDARLFREGKPTSRP